MPSSRATALIRRRLFVIGALGIGTLPALVLAQKKGAMARVGLLGLSLGNPFKAALLEGLRQQGYVEGKNLMLIDRSSVDRYENLGPAAKELVTLEVDVIVTVGSTAGRVAHETTVVVPVILTSGSDPVGDGLAKSLSRPGGNVTGVVALGRELSAKHLEVLKEVLPRLRKVAALLNPSSAAEVKLLAATRASADRLGLQIHAMEVRTPEDFDELFAAAGKANCDALLIIPSTMFYPHRNRIISLAAKYRLASITGSTEYADTGILFVYGANREANFRRAGVYAARVLKGEKPAEMPIEQPSQFDLIVNMKTAAALGIRIPEPLRFRATKLVE